jgi:release factor glutamine methyltransferase
LLAHTLGASWLELITDPARRLSVAEATQLAAMVARRARGEPVSRIIGTRGFYGRDFMVTAATLDPRPESETLIDAALARIKPVWGTGAGLDILDIGTGTGCLLLTLLAELPDACGVGIDPSAAALAVARDNAARLGIGGRARWIEGRFEAVASQIRQTFPLIVSNPPYIPTADIAGLDRDVRDFDPHLALDGGGDGLDIYRGIAGQLGKVAARGCIALEVGHDQAYDVAQLIELSTLRERLGPASIVPDMAGKQRCVTFEIRD